ncbi:MAG: NAD(P)-dependent oxidoreductase [Magnetococcales bacterium]|nr:NAD(P)-dependent oxidoreductase [Magnetococcales bacterium]
MKTVVFGGSGFLGSHVADRLSELGHEVVIFDIKPSPYLSANQSMVIGDILDLEQVQNAVDGCDFIYNFAGLADMELATNKPLATVHANITGAINIMEAAVKAKVQRLIYASSVYVYSQKGGFYRCSKQATELYLEEYQRTYGLDFTIMRYGTLYGPRAGVDNAIYRYLKQATDENKLQWNGSGEELREYIFVNDAARLSVDILDEEYLNKHVIITGHHPMKYIDMLTTIKEILGKNIPITCTNTGFESHYTQTPYSFIPKIGLKLVTNYYTDIGQGLLACLEDMYSNRPDG